MIERRVLHVYSRPTVGLRRGGEYILNLYMNTDNRNSKSPQQMIKEGNENQRKSIKEINKQLRNAARLQGKGQGTKKGNGK